MSFHNGHLDLLLVCSNLNFRNKAWHIMPPDFFIWMDGWFGTNQRIWMKCHLVSDRNCNVVNM